MAFNLTNLITRKLFEQSETDVEFEILFKASLTN